MKDWLNSWYKLNEFLIIKNTQRTTARDIEQTVAFKVPCLLNPEDVRIIQTWELELEFRCLVKRHFREAISFFLAPTRWVSMTMRPSYFFSSSQNVADIVTAWTVAICHLEFQAYVSFVFLLFFGMGGLVIAM